jgi:hypothetical protein
MKSAKMLVISSIVLAIGGMFVLGGCAQPPTEKVTTVTTDFKALEDQGAQVFAPDTYTALSGRVSELTALMDAKKYAPATALADSIITEIAAAKTLVTDNGTTAAKDAVASIDAQLAAYKALLTDANVKVLGADAAKYTDGATQFTDKAAALQTTLGAGTVLVAFNDAKTLAGEIAAATQEVTTALETAKAAKAKPAPRKK